MKTSKQRWMWVTVGVLLGGVLGVFGWTLIQDDADAPPLEVELVASEVRFNGYNPVVRLERGRPVRILVRNQESGARPVYHDFAIAGMGLDPTRALAPGESAVVEFTPRKAGTYTYHCPLHPGLMNGKIVVE